MSVLTAAAMFEQVEPTEEQLARWYGQACARWAHIPAGEAKDAKVRATFQQIQSEAEEVCVRLPELDREERSSILDEATLDVLFRFGLPTTDEQQALTDARIDAMFELMQVIARHQKAPTRVLKRLLLRRVIRRATLGWSPF